ncbi:MAG TPA: hypothetical protein VK203_25785 [Nostocaceae cyanobacterium]|nr:hypothetical protein [Nostocaceae cyanobacterium]
MAETSVTKVTKVIDFVPDNWFSIKDKSSVWMRCYRIFRASTEIRSEPKVIEFTNVVIVILYGRVSYLDLSQVHEYVEDSNDLSFKIDMSNMKKCSTNEGTYLVLLTPFDIDGKEGDEFAVKNLLQETVGLLMSLNSRNIAFEKIFDNVTPMTGNKEQFFSPVYINPLYFTPPKLSNQQLSEVINIEKVIYSLPKEQGNRIRLSLRWFESAMRQLGVDSFLSYWIAIETLGMENSDIRPINESLAKIYGLSNYKEANDTFGVGRIYSLRGKIVHDGYIIPIHEQLQRYMEALYSDILLEKLGFPSEYKTKTILEEPDFNFQEYVLQYLKS